MMISSMTILLYVAHHTMISYLRVYRIAYLFFRLNQRFYDINNIIIALIQQFISLIKNPILIIVIYIIQYIQTDIVDLVNAILLYYYGDSSTALVITYKYIFIPFMIYQLAFSIIAQQESFSLDKPIDVGRYSCYDFSTSRNVISNF